ncbi:MAG: hypothetical protein WD468_10635 [Pirellulales bacterium]
MMSRQIVAAAVSGPLGVCLAVLGVLSIGIGEASALDRHIVNAKGFAPPDFTTTFLGTGQLEGQVNPVGFGQAISPGQWLRPLGTQTGTGVVQSTVFSPTVLSGDVANTQAVKIDRINNSPDRWGIPVNNQGYPEYPGPNANGEPLQPCICINWDMRVEGPAGVPGDFPDGDFGPYFGVEANDDDVSGIKLLGSLGVDATTAEVLYQAPGSGDLTPAGPVTVFGTWHNYQIKLDYSTHDYTIYYDQFPLGTFAFVDGQNDQFSEANILALAASGAPADLVRAGTAFFDNFLVQEGGCNVVPEPTSVVLILMGLMGVPYVARRQRG